MAAVEILEVMKDNMVEIGQFTINVADGSFQQDLEGFMSLPAEVRKQILINYAKETILGIYEGFRESIKTPEGRGEILGDVLIGGIMGKAIKVTKAGKTGKGGKNGGGDNPDRKPNKDTETYDKEKPEKQGSEHENHEKKDSSKIEESGDFGKKVDIGVKLEFSQKFTDINHLPPLRQEYIREVWSLEGTVYKLFNEGKTIEEVARTVSQMRRDLGIKYKDLTPPELRERIYARNIEVHGGDTLGPTIEHLREKGKSWEEIIESACRVGGADLLLEPK